MTQYIIRRLFLSVIVLFGVTVIVSGMLHISGDPVSLIMESGIGSQADRAALRQELGLDKPFLLQYLDFVTHAVRGDLGHSLRFRQPALLIVLERLPATLYLASTAMLFSMSIAVPVGLVSAANPNSVIDYVGRVLTLIGQSVPLFWLGIMFILVFSVRLNWFPAAGRQEWSSIVMPAITLGLYPMARITRILRASMREVLLMDYCRTARSKGLSERTVVIHHAFRNAALPVITVIGLQFGYLLGGAVVTETIFAWPGLGWLSIQAIGARDFTLVRAIVAVVAFLFILINLLTDILYAYLNPQIRFA